MKLTKLGLFAFMALLAACSEDNPTAPGYGQIMPDFGADNHVTPSTNSARSGEEGNALLPDINDFTVKIARKDGKGTPNTWQYQVKDFDANKLFSTGAYTMDLVYGSLEDEGFEKPYYIGSTEFNVFTDEVSRPEITATLANTMVSLAYTDAFKKYFTSYSVQIKSGADGNTIDFIQTETRPAYVRPGNIEIYLTATKTNGVTYTLNPASIDNAKERTWYNVTFDVNDGEVGSSQLVVTFDDSTTVNPITISLDGLDSSEAPKIIGKGFTDNTEIVLIEGSELNAPATMDLIGMAGIKSVKMQISSPYLQSLGVPASVDLMNLDASVRSILTSKGMKIGVNEKTDKMGFIDFTDMVPNLQCYDNDPTHSFAVTVVDKFERSTEPLTFKVSTEKLQFSIIDTKPAMIGANQAEITVAYSGKDLANNVVFEGKNAYGSWTNLTTASVTPVSRAAVPEYTVVLNIPSDWVHVFAIRGNYKNNTVITNEDKQVTRTNPAYTFSVNPADIWTTTATIKVTCTEISGIASIATVMLSTDNSTYSATVNKEVNGDMITIKGLTPGTKYYLKLSLDGGTTKSDATLEFTTEATATVPNGNFETLGGTVYSKTNLNQGGTYKATKISATKQNLQTFTVTEPTGWASSNATTCNFSASTQNSWFVLPSVFNTSLSFTSNVPNLTNNNIGQTQDKPGAYNQQAYSGNSMVIRNVAWSNSGTVPGQDAHTAATSDKYYNTKVPTISNKSCGKLWLGTASAEGVDFASRPLALKGYYKYDTSNGSASEQGKVTVTLLNGTTVIGSGTVNLTAVDNYTEFTATITYTDRTKKATKLKIMIQSAQDDNVTVTPHAELFLQEAYGSVLCIDNLTFEY